MTRVWGLLLVVALGGGCVQSCGLNQIDLERMIVQTRLQPYRETNEFPDGSAMRTPPAGTIPQGATLGPEELVHGLHAGRFVDEIPIKLAADAVRAGRVRYETFCAVCHGVLGDGDSPVAVNMTLRRPPSLVDEGLRAAPDGRLYGAVARGYGLMPSYAPWLSVEERWAVVAYVRALQLSRGLPARDLPTALQKEAQPWLR